MSYIESLARNIVSESRRLGEAAGDVADGADVDIDDLRKEIRHLRRDIAKASRRAQHSGADMFHQGLDYAEDAADTTIRTAKEHPVVTAFALLAVGYFTFELFRRH